MSEQTKTVHFSLGANFDTLMGNLAQERLIFNLDPIHALKTFTDSFIGMPEDLALQLLSGKDYVLVPISDGEVTVRERIDGDDYPMLNGIEIIDNFVSQTNKEAKEFGKAICTTFQMPVTTRNYAVDLSLSFNDLVSLFELNGHDKSEFYDSLKDKAEDIKNDVLYADADICDKIQTQLDMIDIINSWKELVDKKVAVIRWMVNKGLAEYSVRKTLAEFDNPEEWLKYDQKFVTFEEMLQEVAYTMDLLYHFTRNVKEGVPESVYVATGNELLDQFFNAEKQIELALKERMSPMPIKEHRNAIWVSPEGKMYGLNGVIANMLHNQIADKLRTDGIIDYTESPTTPTVDAYLEEQGWVKIHDNWIMFDPFAKSRDFTTVTNFITEEQTLVIAKYLEIHYNGFGKFGIPHYPVSYVNFKNMDKFAKNKLFML